MAPAASRVAGRPPAPRPTPHVAAGTDLDTAPLPAAHQAAVPITYTDGFADAFWAGAAIAFVGVVVSLFLVRGRDLRQVEPEQAVPELALDEAA